MIEPQAWQAFGGVAAVVILLGGVAVALQRLGVIGTGGPAAQARAGGDDGGASAIKELAVRLEAVEKEQVRLGWIVEALPEAREFHALSRSVAEARGDMKAIRASLDGIEKMVSGLGGQVASINKHLLEQRR